MSIRRETLALGLTLTLAGCSGEATPGGHHTSSPPQASTCERSEIYNGQYPVRFVAPEGEEVDPGRATEVRTLAVDTIVAVGQAAIMVSESQFPAPGVSGTAALPEALISGTVTAYGTPEQDEAAQVGPGFDFPIWRSMSKTVDQLRDGVKARSGAVNERTWLSGEVTSALPANGSAVVPTDAQGSIVIQIYTQPNCSKQA